MSERLGNRVCTLWYDGPQREFHVVYLDGTPEGRKMVQVTTAPDTEYENYARVDREELLQMLALIDGKPIEDWHGDMRMSVMGDEE